MAPKRAIWRDTPKWRFKFGKWKTRPVITEPHFSPAVPNEERRNQIDQSVVWVALGSDAGYDTFIPAINLRAHQDSYCLLFESSQMSQRQNLNTAPPVTSYALRFPDDEFIDLHRKDMVEKFSDIHGKRIGLTALSCYTVESHCPPIDFGERVIVGQRLFLYDLRAGRPSLVEGTVTGVGSDGFVLDAKWCLDNLMGALVFDETNSLVGVVHHAVGSPVAIHVSRLRELLWTFFPRIKNMGSFHQHLQHISAGVAPLHG